MFLEELSQGLTGVDPAEVALGAGVIGFVFASMLFISAVWFFISAIGYYKMFQKTGESGWKAFIPYYSTYIRFKFAWTPNLFWLFLVTSALAQWLSSNESLIESLIVMVSGITAIVLSIKLDLRIAKSFGKSKKWGVLLFFFPFIVSLILGFGDAKYIGNTTADEA